MHLREGGRARTGGARDAERGVDERGGRRNPSAGDHERPSRAGLRDYGRLR